MKRIWILLLILMLAGCTPTPCPPCPPCETATPTFTPTTTPSATPSATTTPEPLVTLTPTATPPIYLLSLGASSPTAQPGTRVTFTITWDGGPARLQFQYPANTCCAVPDVTTWAATGPLSVQFTFLMQSNASGTKMFRVAAYDAANVLLASASVFVDVIAANPTATPTITPTPAQTATPSAMWRMEPRTWHYVENPARLPLLWLYNASFPVGGPGGEVWSYDTVFVPMDWEVAGGHGWLILETNGGGVWLWVDTIRRLDVADMKFTERAW